MPLTFENLVDITTVIEGKKVIMTMVGKGDRLLLGEAIDTEYEKLGVEMAQMLFKRHKPVESDAWMVIPDHDFKTLIERYGLKTNGYRMFEWVGKGVWIIAMRFRSDDGAIVLRERNEYQG